MGEVSHYRDTFIGGERWVKELWFDRDLGWIGEGKGFFRGQRIQSLLDSMASHPQNAAVYRDFTQGHIFRLILLSLTCPFAHLSENRVVSDLFIWIVVNSTPV